MDRGRYSDTEAELQMKENLSKMTAGMFHPPEQPERDDEDGEVDAEKEWPGEGYDAYKTLEQSALSIGASVGEGRERSRSRSAGDVGEAQTSPDLASNHSDEQDKSLTETM